MVPIQEQIKLTLISYLPFVTRKTPIIKNGLAKWAKKDSTTRCRISGKKHGSVRIESHHILQYAIPFNPFRFARFNRYDMEGKYHVRFHQEYGYWNPLSFIYIFTWRRKVLGSSFTGSSFFFSFVSWLLNGLSVMTIILIASNMNK